MKDAEDVAALVRIGGRRTPIPEGAAERVRRRTEQAWRRKVRSRRRRAWAWRGLAATALAAGLAAAAVTPFADRPPAPVARVVRVDGTAWAVDAAGTRRPLTVGSLLSSGDRLDTAGRVAIDLGGRSLRLDRQTRGELTSAAGFRLDRGALYVASAGREPIEIVTPWGRVRELGTRFLVSVGASQWSVLVREGSVVAETAAGSAVAVAGQSLRGGAGEPLEAAPARAADWSWVRDVAPLLAIEGRRLGAFLDWVRAETGWSIAWGRPELEAEVSGAVLHGSLEGLTFEQALDAVLASCGLRHEVAGDRLTLLEIGEVSP